MVDVVRSGGFEPLDAKAALGDGKALLEGCLGKCYDALRYGFTTPDRALRDIARTLPTVLTRLETIALAIEGGE